MGDWVTGERARVGVTIERVGVGGRVRVARVIVGDTVGEIGAGVCVSVGTATAIFSTVGVGDDSAVRAVGEGTTGAQAETNKMKLAQIFCILIDADYSRALRVFKKRPEGFMEPFGSDTTGV